MTRTAQYLLIRRHLQEALWLADGLPTSPGQLCLRDTLLGAVQEVEVLFPLSMDRDGKGRAL